MIDFRWPLFVLFIYVVWKFASAIEKVFVEIHKNHRYSVARMTGLVFIVEGIWLALTPVGFLTAVPVAFILVGALWLFSAAVEINSSRPLSLAYSRDIPQHLQRSGPYRWVRHPFYSSYLLGMLGAAVAIHSLWALLPVLTAFAIYFHAARFEEMKFEASDLCSQYARYKAEVGMFFPRFSQLFLHKYKMPPK